MFVQTYGDKINDTFVRLSNISHTTITIANSTIFLSTVTHMSCLPAHKFAIRHTDPHGRGAEPSFVNAERYVHQNAVERDFP